MSFKSRHSSSKSCLQKIVEGKLAFHTCQSIQYGNYSSGCTTGFDILWIPLIKERFRDSFRQTYKECSEYGAGGELRLNLPGLCSNTQIPGLGTLPVDGTQIVANI
jgi:hypothetical protein